MAKTEWLKKTLPQGFKKEFLGPEQQSHRISRGRDFLKVEFLRYCTRPSQAGHPNPVKKNKKTIDQYYLYPVVAGSIL